MDNSKRAILDHFGQALMEHVRDAAYAELHRVLSGQMRNPPCNKECLEKYRSFDPDTADVVHRLMSLAVDSCLVNFLYFLDEYKIEVNYSYAPGERADVRALSDGLVGEVYDEDGWYAKFSKFKDRIEPLK